MEIPSTYNGKAVTAIGSRAFENCVSLTSIIIPNSVTSIENYAFNGCAGLTEITIPKSVVLIYGGAFSGCDGLNSLTLQTEKGYKWQIKVNNTWVDCSSYTDAEILAFAKDGNRIEQVSHLNYTLSYSGESYRVSGVKDKSITSVEILATYNGKPVTEIGSGAFQNCTSLTSITIPDSVTYIESYAFNGCTGLSSISISSGVTEIGSGAFSGCTSLTSITIPNNVRNIFWGAFNNSGITNVTLYAQPGHVWVAKDDDGNIILLKNLTSTELAEVLKGTANIHQVAVRNSVYYRWVYGSKDYWIYGVENKDLTTVNIASTINGKPVTSIECNAFNGCTSLTNITIPDSVTYIESRAFQGCTSLTSIKLSSNLLYIETNAFNGCTSLREITIPSSVDCIEDSVFNTCTSLTSIKFETMTGYKWQVYVDSNWVDCSEFFDDEILVFAKAGNEFHQVEDN